MVVMNERGGWFYVGLFKNTETPVVVVHLGGLGESKELPPAGVHGHLGHAWGNRANRKTKTIQSVYSTATAILADYAERAHGKKAAEAVREIELDGVDDAFTWAFLALAEDKGFLIEGEEIGRWLMNELGNIRAVGEFNRWLTSK